MAAIISDRILLYGLGLYDKYYYTDDKIKLLKTQYNNYGTFPSPASALNEQTEASESKKDIPSDNNSPSSHKIRNSR